MVKRYMVLGLIASMLNLFLCTSLNAETREEKSAKFAGKVQAKIAKLGTGRHAKVEVKTKDGTKLKGYISEITGDEFVVTNEETGLSTRVPFVQTKQVKGNNLSTGVKVVIGVAILLLVVGLIGAYGDD